MEKRINNKLIIDQNVTLGWLKKAKISSGTKYNTVVTNCNNENACNTNDKVLTFSGKGTGNPVNTISIVNLEAGKDVPTPKPGQSPKGEKKTSGKQTNNCTQTTNTHKVAQSRNQRGRRQAMDKQRTAQDVSHTRTHAWTHDAMYDAYIRTRTLCGTPTPTLLHN